MEIASETVLAGKAKAMVAGGFDSLCEEGSYEFGNMKATGNSETELAMGREPMEMSRPTTTRAGVGPLISPAELPSLNLMVVSSWSLKASVYTF
jgi:3-oxoacyl-(acyl-carrier-protein) synthase